LPREIPGILSICAHCGPHMVKKLIPVTALSNNSLLAPVDDKSGAGGLLAGEIPGILNIYAHCGPMARCPVDVYAASLS